MNLCEIKTRDLSPAVDWDKALDSIERYAGSDIVSGLLHDWMNMQTAIHDFLAILPVHMLLLNENGRVMLATPKMLREVLAADDSAVRDKYLTAVLADCVQDVAQLRPLTDAVSRCVHWRGELMLNDGRVAGARLCPLPVADKYIMVLMLEVLAEGDEQVWWRRLMGVMDESREMITRGRLSGGVMHDVKNMIQNLSGNVQCMELKMQPDDKIRPRLEMMHHQIGEMSHLINNYLQMGKENTRAAGYSVNELVHDTVELISGNLGMNSIEAIEEPGAGLPELCVDATRIKQVLMNCLENSMDAIVERRRRDDNPRLWGEIYVRTFATEDGVAIAIEDNGTGLTDEQVQRFFEPFFSTKEGGHGIGASFSRAVVELHGGKMTAEQREGGGCRVTVYLPLHTNLEDESFNFYDEMAQLDWH